VDEVTMRALWAIALIGAAAGLAGCGSSQRFSVHGQPPASAGAAGIAALPADDLDEPAAPVRRSGRRPRTNARAAAAPEPETTGSVTSSTEADTKAQRREREIDRSLKSICSNC
jgi:hypothetical protein